MKKDKGATQGKRLDNWNQISIKISQVQNTRDCFKQVISQLGVWLLCGTGAAVKKLGQNPNCFYFLQTRGGKMNSCITSEVNVAVSIFSQEDKKYLFSFS